MSEHNRPFKEKLLRSFIVTTVTVACFFCLETLTWIPRVHTQWMKVTSQIVLDKFQFSDMFFYLHKHTEVPLCEGRQVVLLDISDYQTREELTTLFDSVAAAQPYLVALDVIFGPIAIPDTNVNNRLVESVKRLPNLILAVEKKRDRNAPQYYLYRSFFADDIEATEAFINLPITTLRKWSSLQEYQGDTFPSFAYAIMEKAGVYVPNTETEWLIDYSILDTVTLQPSKALFNWSFLTDQIVIIGDTKDLRDLMSVPITLGVHTKVTGVQTHKQIVQMAMAGHWFKQIHEVWQWLIIYIFLWLLILLEPLAEVLAKREGSVTQAIPYEKRKESMQKLCTTILFILFLGFAYILFWGAHLYFNVLLVIIGAPAMKWIGLLVERKINQRRNKA